MATQLRPFLSEIANAIRSKKGTSGVINAQNFASEIASISTGSGTGEEDTLTAFLNERNSTEGFCAFDKSMSLEKLTTLVNMVDTTKVLRLNRLFSEYRGTEVPYVNTSKTTSLYGFYEGCYNLISVPKLDTSNCGSFGNMHKGCSKLTSVPAYDTSKCDNANQGMREMFSGCSLLEKIDVTYLGSSTSFAQSCYSLKKLIIRTMPDIQPYYYQLSNCYHFDGTINATYNPEGLKDGRIYVPDDKVEELKATKGWSDFADIIVPLSTLVE